MPTGWDSIFIDTADEVSRQEFDQMYPIMTTDEDAMDTSQDFWTGDNEKALSDDLMPETPVEEPPSAPSRHPPGRTKQIGGASPMRLKQEASPTPRRDLRPRRAQQHQVIAKAATAAAESPARIRGRMMMGPRQKKNEIRYPKQKPQEKNQGAEYEVEAIVDMCVEQESLMKYYLVKWKGFGDKQNTWEPKRNLMRCGAAIEAFEMGKGRKAKKAKK